MNHICFLSSNLPRRDSRIYLREGLSLVNKGYVVSYIVSDNMPNEVIDGVKIISTGYLPLNRLKRMLFTKRYLLKIAIQLNADIYQLSEPELISLGLNLKRLGKKVIFDMREYYPRLILNKEYLPRFLRKTISVIIEQYINFSLKKYDLLISVTPQLVDQLKKINKNSILVTNFPIIRDVSPISFEEYKNRKNIVCYIGTVYRISRQELILKAINRINNLDYIIAGKMESKQYQSDLFSFTTWKNFKFIDGVSREDILDLFQKATISNVLRDFSKTGSPNGSLGNIKMFESMEAALPIICSDVSNYRAIISKYKCGICVNPNDENEIERALRYLVDNKENAYVMGQNARKAIIEEFNWESQEKIYIEEINKLLK